MALGRGLSWALGSTLVLTALSLWSSKEAPTLVAAAVRDDGSLPPGTATPAPHPMPRDAWTGAADATTPLPTQWPAQALEPAKRDIFQPVLPPAPPPPPVAKAPPPAPPPPPPPPMAPPMNYRFYGQMVTPEGGHIVFLVKGNAAPIEVTAQQTLDDGYVVESITDDAVKLVYPSLGQRAVVGISPPPP
ncbi:hypothetical protein [Rhizobacter sp. SG703]|uniref:hypothetical protein n=1 Tax=Rhizobacter sp. SG703 TaxID=2587140 RepID=UPI0014452BC8|nr:hypothetical protein [Rhizobacter sp. SG703]NKI97729.1 hypothetical protein [Rhizobacter sp. SG703]